MVFPSNPVYLDPPHWQQQQPNQVIPQGISSSATTNDQNNQLLPPLPPLPPPPANPGSVRPGSMAERARLAKIPQPEPALKCPRCESTNTKFCYFNNYSLSQPRHFCKTCRRYWTRGGALRNVPVGGGCRRNKKNKTNPSSSKASSVSNERSPLGGSHVDISSSSSLSSVLNNNPSESIIGHLPFMSSLHSFTHQYGMGNLGLNFSGINNLGTTTSTCESTSQTEMGFMGINGGGGGVQQFPFFESTPSTSLLYPFQGEVMEGQANSTRVSQLGQVKMEDNNQGGINLTSRPFMGVGDWTGNNTWSDLSVGGSSGGGAGLNSSASPHDHQHLHHHL